MSKLVLFPNLREARREASEWVVRVDRGLSSDERTSLRSWAATPINKRALREMATLWNDMSVLNSLAELFPLETSLPGDPVRPSRWVALGLAAALAIAFTAGILLHDREDGPPLARVEVPVPEQRIETPVGTSRTVALRDGSAVVLNTDTALAVQFASGHRDLRLARGEAHFRVAHDASSPFRVFVGGRTVQAVGTAFSVRLLEDGQVDVMVTEGTVRVETGAGDPPRLVGARQVLRLDGAGEGVVRTIEPVEVDIRLAWQRGMLVFQGEPLSSVLEEFGRYTTQPLVIADPQLRGLRVGGYFRAGDVDALLVALRENFRIASTRDARGRILLSAAH